MDYQNFIKTELLILVPVLYFVGIGLKKSKLSDRWIPLLIGGISIILSMVWVIATSDLAGVKDIAYAMFTAISQGILIAGASVYVNQLYVQAKKEK